jgi:hypothetical protein
MTGTNAQRISRRVTLLGLAALALGSAALGCGLISADIFDIPITLQAQTYTLNLGNNTGKVQPVPCRAEMDNCALAASGITLGAGSTVAGKCDTAAMTCTAEVTAVLTYPVTLAEDQSFATSVGGKAVNAVRTIEFSYGVPTNTTTVDLPTSDLYIGPQNAKTPADQGVVFIDKIPAIARGTTIPDGSRKIAIADGTPAREKFIYYVQNPRVPFVLMLVTKPVVRANQDMPAGRLELKLTPKIVVGLPR